MKPIKQIVYLPTNKQCEYSLAYWDKRDWSYQVEKDEKGEDISLKPQEGYFFIQEQLNQLLREAFEAGQDSKEDEINGDGETSFEEFINDKIKLT